MISRQSSYAPSSSREQKSVLMRKLMSALPFICIGFVVGMLTSSRTKSILLGASDPLNVNSGRVDMPSIVINSQSVVVNKPEAEATGRSLASDRQNGPVHVLYTICGNNTGFIAEWITSFKATLLNAPLDLGMTIHIMADNQALNAIYPLFNETKMNEWRTRNQISINLYDVSSKQLEWRGAIRHATRRKFKKAHTMGSYYRLFAFSVIPQDIHHIVYMDTDVIMMANIQEIWALRNNSLMFQWSETECSGFLLMNMEMWREKFWDLNKEVHRLPTEKTKKPGVGDQSMLRLVAKYNRHLVSYLPDEWDNHMANGLWRLANKAKELPEKRPRMGYVHFNGGGRKKDNVFEQENAGWAIIRYYASHPWNWVRYQLETQVSKEDGHVGYQMHLNFTTVEASPDSFWVLFGSSVSK